MKKLTLKSIFCKGGLMKNKFDHFEYRPGQLAFARAVQQAIEKKHYLIAEAGTGTGKTLSYLIPSILSRKKVVISTGTKTLQEQIFNKDIPLLKKILPFQFSAALMKGRANYLCIRKYKDFQIHPMFDFSEEEHFFQQIRSWVTTTTTGDRSELDFLPDDFKLWNEIAAVADTCLWQKCSLYRDCFITKMRTFAARADIIIVNHHLFLTDLILRRNGSSELIPTYDVVVFDEAHQLESAATQYFGLVVSNYHILELIKDIKRHILSSASPQAQSIQNLLTAVFYQSQRFFLDLCEGQQDRFRIREESINNRTWENFESFKNVLHALCSRLDTLEKKTDDLEICRLRTLEICGNIGCILEQKKTDFVSWCEKRNSGIFLHCSPIDVGEQFRELLYPDTDTIVLTSATLSAEGSFSYYKGRLGLDKTAPPDELIVASDFDFATQTLLYLPEHITDPNSPSFISDAASHIEEILRVSSGRAFVLFTSYRNMEQIYAILKERLPFSMLLQGTKPRMELLKCFIEDVGSVLFATSSFWEGVDVRGESLSCVIIDRLPFASPKDPIVEARIEAIANGGGQPFFDYQVPQAIIALKQGMGRLIRSRNDRGLLCVLDRRIYTRTYGRLFLKSLPECRLTRKLEEVKIFFQKYF